MKPLNPQTQVIITDLRSTKSTLENPDFRIGGLERRTLYENIQAYNSTKKYFVELPWHDMTTLLKTQSPVLDGRLIMGHFSYNEIIKLKEPVQKLDKNQIFVCISSHNYPSLDS